MPAKVGAFKMCTQSKQIYSYMMKVPATSVARMCGIGFAFGAILSEIADLALAPHLAPPNPDHNILEYIGIIMAGLGFLTEFWNLTCHGRPLTRAIGTLLAIVATMGIALLLVRSVLSAVALFHYEAAPPEPDFQLSRWLRTEEKRRLEERARRLGSIRVVAATFYGLLYCTLMESLLQVCCRAENGSPAAGQDMLWGGVRTSTQYTPVTQRSVTTEQASISEQVSV
ncbi:uncharacterized protein LOC129598041 [Paramacrobiotus metropolitanus]|uniref:uncharacterized protein LOC129598041 n=1 Tax=Paramacrobiotus metropolitanus TaxID=2943436 RepID=UPI002445ADA5|nr:uncharacterized protein LOC129598041 [Paramacrobiotus metropolitanus]